MADRFSIVLAHGRAAQFEIPAIQSQQWAQALLFALNRVGSRFASQVDVRYAYFGDFWRSDIAHPAPVFSTAAGDRVAFEGDPPALKVTMAEPQPGGFGGVATAADLLLPDWILGGILRRAIPDVFQYLEDAGIRRNCNDRLVETCRAADAGILVGFSMGSIVGYETLRTAPGDFPVKTLVTCGSPLGLGPINRSLRELAGGPTPFPPNLRLWLNLWSGSDVATGIHGQALADLFVDAASGRAIQDGENFGHTAAPDNVLAAHDALDYLSSIAMGVALHTALIDLEAARGG